MHDALIIGGCVTSGMLLAAYLGYEAGLAAMAAEAKRYKDYCTYIITGEREETADEAQKSD